MLAGMPWSYAVPPEVHARLEEALARGGSLAAVANALHASGITPSSEALRRIEGVLRYRSRGPAEIWGEVVDDLNARGVEAPPLPPSKPEPHGGLF